MRFRTSTRSAIGLLGLLITAGALAVPAPVIKFLQPLGPGGGLVSSPSISPDGRYIAYRQDNSADTAHDIHLYDRVTGTLTQANLTLNGTLPVNARCDLPAVSNDGLLVVFGCNTAQMGLLNNQLPGAGQAYFVFDRLKNKTELLAQGSSDAYVYTTNWVALSANGRYAAYRTWKNGANGVGDFSVVIRDMTSKISLVTSATSAYVFLAQAPSSISNDGNYVVYGGKPSGLITQEDLLLFDRANGVTSLINVKPDGLRANGLAQGDVAISEDGNFIAFYSTGTNLMVPSLTGTPRRVYLRERSTGKTELISPANLGGTPAGVALSADGRHVSYSSGGVLYVYDRLTKKTRSIGGAAAVSTRISRDGRYVVFQTNQTPDQTRAIALVDFGARAALTLSAYTLSLTEGGIAGTYSAVLDQVPDYDVTVALSTNAQLSLARTQLNFTPANWNVPQIISVQAVADGATEGKHTATIVHTVTSADPVYSVVPPADVTVTIADGITPTIVAAGATWTRTEMPLSGTAAPGSTVLLTAANRSTGWLSAVSTVADAQGNWSYTLSGYTDGILDLDAQADGVKSVVRSITVSLTVTPPAPTYIDVTGYIRTTALTMAYNRVTGKYVGNFMLTNTGSSSLAGPLHVQFDSLTTGVKLDNATSSHDGSSYITVPAGLEPDGSVTISLIFDNPARVAIGYNAKIYSGNF